MQSVSIKRNLLEAQQQYEQVKLELVRLEGTLRTLQQFVDLGIDIIEVSPTKSSEVIDGAPTIGTLPAKPEGDSGTEEGNKKSHPFKMRDK